MIWGEMNGLKQTFCTSSGQRRPQAARKRWQRRTGVAAPEVVGVGVGAVVAAVVLAVSLDGAVGRTPGHLPSSSHHPLRSRTYSPDRHPLTHPGPL